VYPQTGGLLVFGLVKNEKSFYQTATSYREQIQRLQQRNIEITTLF